MTTKVQIHGELKIHALGGLEVIQQETPLTSFMSNKAPALLLYLAMTQRAHQREALATLLWSEMADTDATNNLRQVLTSLRKFIEPHLGVTRDSIGFNRAAPYVLDVEAFEHHLHASRALPPELQLDQLQQAVTLYAGDFLAGFFVSDAPSFDVWLLAQRAPLHEQDLHALQDLAQIHSTLS